MKHNINLVAQSDTPLCDSGFFSIGESLCASLFIQTLMLIAES